MVACLNGCQSVAMKSSCPWDSKNRPDWANAFADQLLLGNFSVLLFNRSFHTYSLVIRQKKNICVFPVTRPTLIFPSDPKVFIGIPKKMKFYHTHPTLFAAIFIGFATFAIIFEAVLLFKHLF